jgi:hypothetical protein
MECIAKRMYRVYIADRESEAAGIPEGDYERG